MSCCKKKCGRKEQAKTDKRKQAQKEQVEFFPWLRYNKHSPTRLEGPEEGDDKG